jgi:DNA-binding transcriptional regulator YiaG
MTDNSAFTPDRIRALRRSLGLNQTEFAEALGMTHNGRQQTVSYWETGVQVPTIYKHVAALLDLERKEKDRQHRDRLQSTTA